MHARRHLLGNRTAAPFVDVEVVTLKGINLSEFCREIAILFKVVQWKIYFNLGY
jgi:hypothetical protein